MMRDRGGAPTGLGLGAAWVSRVRGPVRAGGVAWTVAVLVLVLGLTDILLLPALAFSGLPGPLQIVVALVAGAALRLGLGAFVAWRLLRSSVEDASVVVRTVIVGVLAGLVLAWLGGFFIVRPSWGPREWMVEAGLFAAGTVLWVAPCALGAYLLARRVADER